MLLHNYCTSPGRHAVSLPCSPPVAPSFLIRNSLNSYGLPMYSYWQWKPRSVLQDTVVLSSRLPNLVTLLHDVTKQTTHAGQTTITISTSHAKSRTVQTALQALSGFLANIKSSAEQLTVNARLALITRHAFRVFLERMPLAARLLPAPS